ncbi:amidase family protein [Streptococcus uberis]|uniref:amidase family protein n=1 Tax=Streptococcus uberis TaxID=1349 RepID=UPI003D361919
MPKKKLFVICGIVIAIVIGIFLVLKNVMPENEERIFYGRKERLQQINNQLVGIDLKKVRAKKNLIMENSIQEIQVSISKGRLTYEELIAFYLDRIKTYDLGKRGLNSVIEINPHALESARQYDQSINKAKGLTGIPVLIKDNINTKDMPTSGGTFALKDFRPKDNATVVNELIKSGAIILGKSNLSELANFMDFKMPSGYSSKAGQTHNPFNPMKLSPLGSSSGSGVAVAANFSTVAIGTETTGSIIAPSTIHSIVGFKPQREAISTEGVIPLSPTLDTVGTMAKNVADAISLYNASITDKSKTITLNNSKDFIKGKRIGIVGDKENKLKTLLIKNGAIPVNISISEKDIDNGFMIDQEFKGELSNYLQKYDAPVKSLSDLIAFNQKDLGRRAKYGQALLEEANDERKQEKQKVKKMVAIAQRRLKNQFINKELDAIVFYDNSGVLLPAVAGYPEMTVPIGKSKKGEPIGASFVTLNNQEQFLADLSYSFEQKTQARLIPQKYLDN